MDFFDEDLDKEEANGKIPVRDKRRFNADGEQVREDEPAVDAKPTKSAAETALEQQLASERERREAAEAKLVGVQAKFEEAKAALERETADMRDRLRRTLDDKAKQEQFNFLTTLLPVLDNLNLAIQASETDPDVAHLRDGVVGTARSFEQALMSVGVQHVASVGEVFNPELHEAVDMKQVAAEDDGKITAEYSRGYRFGDRLLRPARVQVGRGAAGKAAE
ncbi:MAG TPA: nucleotide exchange factor GrpE [Pyrinomonadaceae bacterium]|nr:nucleotide exchange factor GrpE [Pyrinomonadaceae bacterium]